ncbi:MAG: hypothetical protein HZA53_16215 [Planctomycetes bacterium]|nr:hypothetical protein [Planctomycetota bacterium]
MHRFFHAAVALSATALLSASVSAQTIGCELGGAGGIFPTAGTGGGGTYPTTLPPSAGIFPLTVVTVPGGATVVTEVKLHGLAHTYINDLQMVLTDPVGGMHNLLYRPAGSCDFTGGDYSIVPTCGLQWAATCTTTAAPGAYDQYAPGWASGTLGIDNQTLDTIPAQTGSWTLTIYDWAAIDVGTLTSWDLCFGTPVPTGTPGAAPSLTTPVDAGSVLGPTVTLTWAAVSCATSYEVEVDAVVYPTASTTYGFASTLGAHTWRARGIGASGTGPWSAPFTFTDIGVGPTPCTGQELTTLFAQNNGGAVGGQVFFDVNIVNPAGINVAQLETNTGLTVGTPFSMNIYTKAGTFVGSETNLGAWTLTATGSGVSAGSNLPSLLEFPDALIPAGVYGVALVMVGAAHQYTGTGALPPPTVFSNADLTITGGAALNVPWTGTPFTPRMWNGRIRYNCSLPPSPFCFGDGTLVDHTTPCPCTNNGTAGNGCANSANPSGANLATSGATVTDNVVLLGSGMPATVSCIYLQGTGNDDIAFGDGVRCTGGTLLRLRTKANVGGASSFPDSVETVTLSQRGGVTVGSGAVRNYQTYYRNSAALFCPPETFNVTNGMQVTW